MPTIDYFEGIKINAYFKEHLPPHIHAEYAEHEVLLVIRNGNIYEGSLPSKQLKKARKWLAANRAAALAVFYELNPNLKR